MQIQVDADNKVQIRVIKASRDKDGKMKYETHETIDVLDAKPEEVFAVCKEAILRAPSKK